MTPRERMLAALRGHPVDRVPLVLPGFQSWLGGEMTDISDPLRRRVTERICEEMHVRVPVGTGVNRTLVTPPQRMRSNREKLLNGNTRTTTTIDTPKGVLTAITEHSVELQTSWQVKYPIETLADIDRIASVPWELPPNVQPPDRNNLPEGFNRQGIVHAGISSPMVCVSGMMRYEMFLELCATNLALVREMTEICRQRVLACVKAVLARPGVEYVWMGGSEWVTPPMASPETYDALVQEQERSIIEYVHTHSEAVVHVHCHGHVRHALGRTIERGADYTEPVEPPPDGDITMAEAKQIAAGQITLGGNVECRILCNESEQAVEAATRTAFEGGKRRFVLRPTEGPSPTLTKREFRNWMKMIDVWEELSRID